MQDEGCSLCLVFGAGGRLLVAGWLGDGWLVIGGCGQWLFGLFRIVVLVIGWGGRLGWVEGLGAAGPGLGWALPWAGRLPELPWVGGWPGWAAQFSLGPALLGWAHLPWSRSLLRSC